MIKINGKIMEEKLKRGWTLSRFAKRFNVTEEEFTEALKKTFSPKAYSGIVSRLKKNEKKANKEDIVSDESTIEDIVSDLSDNSSLEGQLQSLKKTKEDLEKLLNEKELEHKSLVEKRLAIKKSISGYEKKLIKLKNQITEYKSEIESLLSQYEDIYQQMHTANSEISETKKAIGALDEKIEAMSKITVYVYESGEFEIESFMDIEIPDWKSFYDKLIINDELECLTVKQIKILAKSLAYAEFFKIQNISYEIIFENEIVEDCFNKLN